MAIVWRHNGGWFFVIIVSPPNPDVFDCSSYILSISYRYWPKQLPKCKIPYYSTITILVLSTPDFVSAL